jgi:hypothetical protein
MWYTMRASLCATVVQQLFKTPLGKRVRGGGYWGVTSEDGRDIAAWIEFAEHLGIQPGGIGGTQRRLGERWEVLSRFEGPAGRWAGLCLAGGRPFSGGG